MNRKVRVGSQYYYDPVWFDIFYGKAQLKSGDLVKVVNKFGCPPANTMGMCYVELNGKFAGMVCTNSLIPKKEWRERQNANSELFK